MKFRVYGIYFRDEITKSCAHKSLEFYPGAKPSLSSWRINIYHEHIARSSSNYFGVQLYILEIRILYIVSIQSYNQYCTCFLCDAEHTVISKSEILPDKRTVLLGMGVEKKTQENKPLPYDKWKERFQDTMKLEEGARYYAKSQGWQRAVWEDFAEGKILVKIWKMSRSSQGK